jgi:hypothetical protein
MNQGTTYDMTIANQFPIMMTWILTVIGDLILACLDVSNCACVLTDSRRMGSKRIEQAAQTTALESFEEMIITEGVLRMDEQTLEGLLELESSKLVAKTEEVVFGATVRWIEGKQRKFTSTILSTIRFPLMREESLTGRHMCSSKLFCPKLG